MFYGARGRASKKNPLVDFFYCVFGRWAFLDKGNSKANAIKETTELHVRLKKSWPNTKYKYRKNARTAHWLLVVGCFFLFFSFSAAAAPKIEDKYIWCAASPSPPLFP
jgi:hypothetical protein